MSEWGDEQKRLAGLTPSDFGEEAAFSARARRAIAEPPVRRRMEMARDEALRKSTDWFYADQARAAAAVVEHLTRALAVLDDEVPA